MKQMLLRLLFLVFLFGLLGGVADMDDPTQRPLLYPNPASDFIRLSSDEVVQQFVLYNFSGRKVLSFKAQKGSQYNISELPTGMYLVQFLDTENHIIHTQRLNKR